MRTYATPAAWILLIAAAAFQLSGCDLPVFTVGEEIDGGIQDDTNPPPDYTEQLKELYEKAKEAGEQVPEDVYDWAKEDVKKMGTWEYKVVTLSANTSTEIEAELNKLGQEKWQCFWVEKEDGRVTFYFRRQARSYLKTLPFREILRIIPLEDARQVMEQ